MYIIQYFYFKFCDFVMDTYITVYVKFLIFNQCVNVNVTKKLIVSFNKISPHVVNVMH